MTAHVKAPWSSLLVDSHHFPIHLRRLLAQPLPPQASMKSPSLCRDQMELFAQGVRVLPAMQFPLSII